VLVDENGPVVIDLPQAVDASANNHAESMLERDVGNITAYYGHFAPQLLQTRYAAEMWALYEDGKLTEDTVLTGFCEEDTESADVDAVLKDINAVIAEEEARLIRLQEANEPD
jgi:RIO kinase 1